MTSETIIIILTSLELNANTKKKKKFTQLELAFIAHAIDCPKKDNPRRRCKCGVLDVAQSVQQWIQEINTPINKNKSHN